MSNRLNKDEKRGMNVYILNTNTGPLEAGSLEKNSRE